MAKKHVKRNFKDTVWGTLYAQKKELLELYNGINHTHYENPDELEIKTVKDAIFMGMKNDVSCCVDMRLQLYEQQSTVNPNMPKRMLGYSVQQIEEMVAHYDIYSGKMIPLPTPKFFVFYNGVADQPEEKYIKLSDCYVHKEENPSLELIVKQLNINPGYNEELKKKCPTLMQYVEYVSRVRHYSQTLPLKEAVIKAVDECIKEGILREFLIKNKAQVIKMSIFEYDREKHMKTLYEEAYEDGEEAGYIKGEIHTLISLVKDHILTKEDAAVRANMSLAEFQNELLKNCNDGANE